jgi:preprotein translocase subunit SecG
VKLPSLPAILAFDPASGELRGIGTAAGDGVALAAHIRDRQCPRSRRRRPAVTAALYPDAMENILSIVQVILAVVVIFLVLMHSGKDAGLSGAFGVGTGSGPFGGGSLVERNLNRWTIGFAVAFVVNTVILLKL